MAAREDQAQKQTAREGHALTFWAWFHVVAVDRWEGKVMVGHISTVQDRSVADMRKSAPVEKDYHKNIFTNR